jgi:hypothetical protein
MTVQKTPCLDSDMFQTVAKGRQVNRYHVQAVKQIQPESAALHFANQVAMRRRYYANLDFPLGKRSHRPEFALL